MQAIQDNYSGTKHKLAQLQAIWDIFTRTPELLPLNDAQKEIIHGIIASRGLWTTLDEKTIETGCWLLLNRCLQIFSSYIQSQHQVIREREHHPSASQVAYLRETEFLFGNLRSYTDGMAPFAAWDADIFTTIGQQQILAMLHHLQQQAHASLGQPIFSHMNANTSLTLADLVRLTPEDNPITWLRTQRLQEAMYCLIDFLLEDIPMAPYAIIQSPVIAESLHPNVKTVAHDFVVTLTSLDFHELGTILHFDAVFVLPKASYRLEGHTNRTRTMMWDGFETVFDATGGQYLMQMYRKGCAQWRGRKRQEDLITTCWPPLPSHGTLTLQTAALELSVFEEVTVEERPGRLVALSQAVPRPAVQIEPSLEVTITY